MQSPHFLQDHLAVKEGLKTVEHCRRHWNPNLAVQSGITQRQILVRTRVLVLQLHKALF